MDAWPGVKERIKAHGGGRDRERDRSTLRATRLDRSGTRVTSTRPLQHDSPSTSSFSTRLPSRRHGQRRHLFTAHHGQEDGPARRFDFSLRRTFERRCRVGRERARAERCRESARVDQLGMHMRELWRGERGADASVWEDRSMGCWQSWSRDSMACRTKCSPDVGRLFFPSAHSTRCSEDFFDRRQWRPSGRGLTTSKEGSST